jgi:hypothetical protein
MGRTERDKFNTADYVAHVKVISTELRDDKVENPAIEFFGAKNEFTEYIRVSFKEIEIFKGIGFSPKYLTELPKTNGSCMFGLLPGQEYVVFLAKDSMGFVIGCSGTFNLRNSTTSTEKLRDWAKDKEK